MKHLNYRILILTIILLSLPALACGLLEPSELDGPPSQATIIQVTANSSLSAWLEQAAYIFNENQSEADVDPQYYVQLDIVESGEAVTQLVDTAEEPALWIPENEVWVDLLADQGNDNFQNDCQSVAESPLVIGMWRPVAESLGWPGLPLGWLDIGSLAADPNAWAYYSGGEYGDSLRLSHTHPGLSGSGTSTLLAIVQAAESTTDQVSPEDINKPIVQASVSAFESAVSSFNTSTDNLGKTMKERGPGYLGAAVMYESTIVQHGNGEIVAIYPLEGTFMATHPACINQGADVLVQGGADQFRDYLLSVEGQELALTTGLRPVNSAVPLGLPIDESHGVDPAQPEKIFAPPSIENVYAIQELWQSARKPVNMVMLLDTSGSMRGDKIESMKEAAVQFVDQMGDDDNLSLIEFYSEPELLVSQAKVGESRADIIAIIEEMKPGGDTTLFDAIGDGAALMAATSSPDAANALVILTDGQDTSSERFTFNDHLIEIATANDSTVFTIAYGVDADEALLSELASQGNGNFYRGDEASIAAIYEEMSAAFGGSLGVGR